MNRGGLAALLAAITMTASAACQAADAAEPAELRDARDAYRQCAMSKLSENPSRTVLPRKAVEAAVDACNGERLALTGHFALAHLGSREVAQFGRHARRQLVDELTGWLTELEAMYVERVR